MIRTPTSPGRLRHMFDLSVPYFLPLHFCSFPYALLFLHPEMQGLVAHPPSVYSGQTSPALGRSPVIPTIPHDA